MEKPLHHSDLWRIVSAQSEPHRALFTDIDDTFIDRARREAPMAAAWEVREWADTNNCPIIFVSGVEFTGVQPRIEASEIPAAEAIIGAVGTEIWLRQAHNWIRDTAYDKIVQASGYNRDEVTAKAAVHIADLNSQQPGLQLQFQPLPDQLTKVSLHFFATEADAAQLDAEFSDFFPTYFIVVCKEIHHNATLPPDAEVQKYCLDIVPATKQTAIDYLIGELALQAGYKAGDSGNDTAMLLNPDPLLGILVGGYKSEAYQAIQAEIVGTREGPMQQLRDGRSIYVEDNASRFAAESILHAIQLTTAADR